MGKTRAVNFYDYIVGIWGGENFMSDVLEGGQLLTQNYCSLVLFIIREV